jgi:hypothetical protein
MPDDQGLSLQNVHRVKSVKPRVLWLRRKPGASVREGGHTWARGHMDAQYDQEHVPSGGCAQFYPFWGFWL